MKAIWLMSTALLACSNEAPITDTTTLTSACAHVDIEPAANQITTDRCNRQLSCGNVGKARTWNDLRHCEVDVAPRVNGVLGVSCNTVDATRLSTCLSEIRDQRCAETGSMPASCEGVQLCR